MKYQARIVEGGQSDMKESRGDKERWSKFCPKCGKKTDELFDSLCQACFTKGIKLIDTEKLAIPIRVNVCEICGGYFKGKGAGKERTSIEEVVTDVGEKRAKRCREPSDCAFEGKSRDKRSRNRGEGRNRS
jgi:NMD protein affecting ribosome stability and mRNA decay